MRLFKRFAVYRLSFMVKLLLLLVFLSNIYYLPSAIKADEIGDLQEKINQLNRARELSVSATKPLEGQLDSLKRQLAQIQASLDNLSLSIFQKERDLKLREKKLVVQQALLASRVRSYYIRSFLTSPLLVILSSQNTSDLFKELSYQQAQAREDHRIITTVTEEIVDLLTQKEKLEKDKARLADLQVQVDKNAAFLGGEIKKAQAYQQDLLKQIVTLSQRQQELIAQKLASLNIPRSAYAGLGGGCVDDRGIDPGFSPRFAFFTYGVPNRVGLNQWGAKGRAESGQSAKQILSAYYNADYTTGYNSGVNIHVVGSNEYGQSFDEAYNIDDYLKHLYEMPSSWPMEALKAQAIAARSYALSYTNNGASNICPSQSCQVVKKEINASSWQAAVDATKGTVLTLGGSPIKAWFSSTHGGFIFSSSEIGWSTTPFTKHGVDATGTISNLSDLISLAYDKNSPWFYCDWGARASFSKTAWLKADELSDIINVMLLAKADSSTQAHLSQLDKPNPDNSETWDAQRVRSELRAKGVTTFSTINSISVAVDSGSGRTTNINVSGDGGNISLDGASFKSYFNLRAPANIQIVGPLFNVESR